MFKPAYKFFGHELQCAVIHTTKTFKLEVKDMYPYLKSMFSKWKWHRIDTTNQIGFPDILLLRGGSYILIEAKILKKKQLNSIENDLVFQPGQLPFMKRSLTLRLDYILAVAKDNQIAFIKGAY